MYRTIAIKKFDSFVDHRFIIEPKMDSLLGNTLILMKGKKWREMRAFLSPAFTGSKMRRMFELVRECAIESKEYLLKMHLNQIDSEHTMEMEDLYSRITCDVIASCAFGLKINSLIDRNNEFYETGCKLQDLSSFKSFAKLLGFRMFPWFMAKFRIQFVDKAIRDVFSKLVLQNIESRRTNNIVRPDLIDSLMRVKRDNLQQNATNTKHSTNDERWSDDEIISQAFIFFLAGFDTTMWVLTATTYELALNPQIQQRLVNEIDNMQLSDQHCICYDQLNKMKYLDMVLMEVLRMHSPAVLIDRLCTKRTLLSDGNKLNVYIEKGDHIWIPIIEFHKFYPQPNVFDPERFNDENRKKINPAHYVPFGIGPRACIGYRFALMEVKLIIFYMLKQFQFNVSTETEIPMKIKSTPFGIHSLNGVMLTIKRRK